MPKPVITGTDGIDVINGQQVAETIFGQAGNDTINGNAGDDDIFGGDGDDILSGGTGNDLLSGGSGNDTAVFTGNLRDYSFTNGADGSLNAVHVRGTRLDGSDTVQSDVEVLRFADRVVNLQDNTAPETQNDARTTHEDARLINASSVLANDFDVQAYLGRQSIAVTAVNGDSHAIGSPVTLPSGAVLTMRADGTYDYDPGALGSLAAGESYQDTFSYTVTDSAGAASTATATITVAGRNDAPVATAQQTVEAHAGDPVVTGVLGADDIDRDDNPASLTYQIVNGPAEGTLTLTGNSFAFAPGTAFQDLGAGETRDVSFAFRATDGHGAASNIGMVSISVEGVNDAPVITQADAAATITERLDASGENLPPDHSATGVIAFADLDTNDQHSVTVIPVGANYVGALTVEASNGAVNWSFNVPDADLDGLGQGEHRDQIYNVTISDGAASVTQQITVTLNGTDDAPQFLSPDGTFSFAVTENQPAGAAIGQTLGLDPDDASVNYAITGGTGQGLFTIDTHGNITANGAFDYEAQTRYSLEVEVRDAHGAAGVAQVEVDILDRAPVIHTIAVDRQTHTIEEYESNDVFRIDRLSTDLSLQYAQAPGVYLDLATAKIAANLAQVGVVDVGVAFYADGHGGTNAIAAIDEDAFGTVADMWLDLHNAHPGQVSAHNFEFIA